MGEENDDQTKSSNISDLLSLVDDLGNVSEAELDTRKLVSQMNRKKKKSGGFQSMGLSHNVYKGVIKKGYKVPTPIQRKCIPLIMDGKDVVAMARTGSGKTAAFLIPLFEKLQTRQSTLGARALLLSPTRELALQTMKFFKELGRFTSLRVACILGGDSMDDQFAALHENPDVIVATPGRLMHVLMEMELRLKCMQYVVFDEADRLFELGFQDQLHEILKRLPEDRHTLLFSATLPKQLIEFAKAGLNDPTLVRLDLDSKLSEQLKLAFLHCRLDDKLPTLLHLLKNVFKEEEQTVVFVATKHHVEYIKEVLLTYEIEVSYSYSSLDQIARNTNISKFRSKQSKVLVVTDVAARGLDIPMLDNVVNFSFPPKSKLFLHRVGRVARAGRTGSAYSLVCPDELPFVIDLHLFLGRPLTFVKSGVKYNAWDSLYGSVAQLAIDEERASLQTVVNNAELDALLKVSQNAYKQYLKSRPSAAAESIKRTKEILLTTKMGIHPIFENLVDNSESARLDLLSSVRKYKPSTTIFEIGSTAKATGSGVMKKTRNRHTKFVAKHQEKLRVIRESNKQTMHQSSSTPPSELPLTDETNLKEVFSRVIQPSNKPFVAKTKKRKSHRKNFRDDEFYIGYSPKDRHSEAGYSMKKEGSNFTQEATNLSLDLMADDDTQMRKQKAQQRKVWDRKRKRFVNAQDLGGGGSGGPLNKKMKNESGAVISGKNKKNFYQEWRKKSKIDEQNNDEGAKKDDWRGGRHRSTGRFNAKTSGKGVKAKSELKRPEQILRQRKQDKINEKNKRRQKRGKKR